MELKTKLHPHPNSSRWKLNLISFFIMLMLPSFTSAQYIGFNLDRELDVGFGENDYNRMVNDGTMTGPRINDSFDHSSFSLAPSVTTNSVPQFRFDNSPLVIEPNAFSLDPQYSSPVYNTDYLGLSFGLEEDFWQSDYPSSDTSWIDDLWSGDTGWSFDNYISDYSNYFTVGAENEYGQLTSKFENKFSSCVNEKFNQCKSQQLGALSADLSRGALSYMGNIRDQYFQERISACQSDSNRLCAMETFEEMQPEIEMASSMTKSSFNSFLDAYRDFVPEGELGMPGVTAFNYFSLYNRACPENSPEALNESQIAWFNQFASKIASNGGLNTRYNCDQLKQREQATSDTTALNQVTSDAYCECMAKNYELDDSQDSDKYSGISCDEAKQGTLHYVAKELSEITSESMQVRNATLMAAIKNPSLLENPAIGACLPNDMSEARMPDSMCPGAAQDQMKELMFNMVKQALPENSRSMIGEDGVFKNVDDISNMYNKNLIVQNMAMYRPDLLPEGFENFLNQDQNARLNLVKDFDMGAFYERLAQAEGSDPLEFSDEEADLLNNMEGVIANFNDNEAQFQGWFANLNTQQKEVFRKLNTLRHIRASDTASRQDIVFDGNADSAWELAKFYRRESRFIRDGLRAQQSRGHLTVALAPDENMREPGWFKLTGDLLNRAMDDGNVLTDQSALHECQKFTEKVINLCNVMSSAVPFVPSSEFDSRPPELDNTRDRYLNSLGIENDDAQKFEQFMCYSRVANNQMINERNNSPVSPDLAEKDDFLNPSGSCTIVPEEQYTPESLFPIFAGEIQHADREEWKARCLDAAAAMPSDEALFLTQSLQEPADVNGQDGFDRHCSEPRPPEIGAVLANTLEALTQNDEISEKFSERADLIGQARARGASEAEIAALEADAASADFLYSESLAVNNSIGNGVRSNNQINSGNSNDGGRVLANQESGSGPGQSGIGRGPASREAAERNMVREEAEIARNAGFDSGNMGGSGFGSNDDIISRVASDAASRSSGGSFNVDQFRESATNALGNIDSQIDDAERRKAVAEAAGSTPENDPAYAALLAELEALKKDQSTLKEMLGNEQKLRQIAEAEAREVEERRLRGEDNLEGSGSGQSQRVAGSDIATGGGSQVAAGTAAAASFGGGGISGGAGGGGSISGGGAISGDSVDYSGGTFTGNTINTNSIGTITLSASESAPVFSAGVQSDQNTNFWTEMIQTSPNNYVLIQTERDGIYYRKSIKGDQIITELVKVDEDTKEIIVINGTQRIDGREIASDKDVAVDTVGTGSGSGSGASQKVFKSDLDRLIRGSNQ